jgi:hypothetical protein
MSENKKEVKSMKKILFGFMFVSVAVLTACTSLVNQGLSFNTNEDILSFQVLAASALLPQGEQTPVSAPNTFTASQLSTSSEDLVDEPVEEDPILENIDPYIELIEQLLGSNQGLSVEVLASDLEGYVSMMTFQTNGLLGESQTYTIYYNMTLEEEDDDESEFVLDGIMILGDQTYTLTGKREVEDDEEEIKFTAKLDDLNYVESKYEVESEEVKFEIKVVLNGIVTSETEIKIETEDDETKIELYFLSGENTGSYEFKYETEDGQPIVKIEYQTLTDGITSSGEIRLLILVDELTGETYYQAFVDPDDDDAYEREIDRDIDDDDEDEEDEEESEDNNESEESEDENETVE